MSDDNFGLDPGAVYRQHLGEKLFGLKHSQIAEAIKDGKIPAPVAAIAGGRAKIWYGYQIIEHRRAQLDAAKEMKRAAPA